MNENHLPSFYVQPAIKMAGIYGKNVNMIPFKPSSMAYYVPPQLSSRLTALSRSMAIQKYRSLYFH